VATDVERKVKALRGQGVGILSIAKQAGLRGGHSPAHPSNRLVPQGQAVWCGIRLHDPPRPVPQLASPAAYPTGGNLRPSFRGKALEFLPQFQTASNNYHFPANTIQSFIHCARKKIPTASQSQCRIFKKNYSGGFSSSGTSAHCCDDSDTTLLLMKGILRGAPSGSMVASFDQ